MLRSPYHAAVQQNLILSLQPDNPKCKSFFEQCNNLDRDIIISTRDRRMESHNLTLLHLAARYGLIKAIEYLISLGQDVDVIDTSVSKRTPLFEAITAMQEDAAYILIKYGARLDYQDVNGENGFHYAARVGARMVKVLYNNCDLSKSEIQKLVSVTNIKLKFPEDIAANSLTKEILMDLRQQGYRPAATASHGRTKKKKRRKNGGKTGAPHDDTTPNPSSSNNDDEVHVE